MLVARRRSSISAGIGTIITNTSVTVATGTSHSSVVCGDRGLSLGMVSWSSLNVAHRIPHACLRPVDKRQYFGDRRVQLGRYGFTHFRGAIQSLGERRILDDGNPMPAAEILDAQGHVVHP